jgi:hypothetical protein
MARADGLPYGDLINQILALAIHRYAYAGQWPVTAGALERTPDLAFIRPT